MYINNSYFHTQVYTFNVIFQLFYDTIKPLTTDYPLILGTGLWPGHLV